MRIAINTSKGMLHGEVIKQNKKTVKIRLSKCGKVIKRKIKDL